MSLVLTELTSVRLLCTAIDTASREEEETTCCFYEQTNFTMFLTDDVSPMTQSLLALVC